MSDDGPKTKDNSFRAAFEENRSAISGIFHAAQDASNNFGRAIAQKVGLEGVEKYAGKLESSTVMQAEINTVAALQTVALNPGLAGKALGEAIREYPAPTKPAAPKV
jgi:hypothetical protein